MFEFLSEFEIRVLEFNIDDFVSIFHPQVPNAGTPQTKGSDVLNSILADGKPDGMDRLCSAKIEFCTSEPRMCARRAHRTGEDSTRRPGLRQEVEAAPAAV